MWTYFIRNYRLTYLLVIAIFGIGLYSYANLERSSEPEVDIPVAFITTAYPGASPEDIENLITRKIEDEVANVNNIKAISSTSSFGVSSISIEFLASADKKESIDDVKDSVDLVKAELPDDASDPIVQEVKMSDTSIITFSISGEYDFAMLKNYAEILEDNFEKIKNVSKVNVIGARDKEIRITLNRNDIQALKIDINEVVQAIKNANKNLPIGNIEKNGFAYGLRFEGEILNVEDFRNIPIRSQENNGTISTVFLKDIADITYELQEVSTISRIGLPNNIPEQTISIDIFKGDEGDIFQVVEEAKEIVNNKGNYGLPEDLEIFTTSDNTVFIERDFNRLGMNFLQTIIAITIILFLGISFREGLVVGFSVPLIFLLCFIVFNFMGVSLNGMTIFSLMISLGLVVDTAVVIIEGADENMKKGMGLYDSIVRSVENYRGPLIAGILTAIAAFLPMLLVSGIVGEYLATIPITLTVALLSSLFVSLFIIPALAYRFLKAEKSQKKVFHFEAWQKLQDKISEKYEKFLLKYKEFITNLIENKKKGGRFIKIILILFFASIALPIFGILRVEMFGKIDVDFFTVAIEAPNGTSLSETEKIVYEVEPIIAKIEGLENYVTNIGTNATSALSNNFSSVANSSSNLATITINLVERSEREHSSIEITERLKEQLKFLAPKATIKVEQISPGPPSGYTVEARIIGNDFQILGKIADDIRKFLESKEGVTDIDTDLDLSNKEFVFTIDRQKASLYGFSAADIANFLRSSVYGLEVMEIDINEDDTKVWVDYDFSSHDTSFDEVLALEMLDREGNFIAIENFLDYSFKSSLVSINRSDNQRQIKVFANTDIETNPYTVSAELQEYLDASYDMPEGYTVKIGGETEDINESFRQLFNVMFLAIVLIGMILVAEFNDYKIPFIIILTIPFAIIGVFPGLVLTGQNLGFMTFLGIVALGGIVVDNAIVLIDTIQKNEKNMPFKEAIIESSVSRLKPIFLTSIDTIIGAIPTALGDEFWRGFSIAVIFGFSFSTLLTLVLIPVLYSRFMGKK